MSALQFANLGKALGFVVRKPQFYRENLTFGVSEVLQGGEESCPPNGQCWYPFGEPAATPSGLIGLAASGHPTAAEKCNELTPAHACPRSTRMPEYQMANPGAKAIAASQSVEARKVGCGSR
jgi:hypothetical protein